jgi:bifunctional non-homologous end joining protein LigD
MADPAYHPPRLGRCPVVAPDLIKPMLAVAGELPTARVDEWAAEMKWDGVRAVTYVTGPRVQVFSRNDRDVSVSYPELSVLARAGLDVVLDGEIVALDGGGRPNFGLLQSRMHVADPAKARRLSEQTAVDYLLFDVLRVDGRDTLQLPYAKRRELLERLGLDECERIAVPPAFHGDPSDAMKASLDAGLEGVVCKKLDSVYQPGRRSAAWVKVKHQRMQEVVVIGWEPGEGRRAGEIGALLLGVNVGGQLSYAGQVGTGFTERALRELLAQLKPLAAKRAAVPDVPAEHARVANWVRPELVGEVVYGEWTRDNRLRHPSWRGLRPDKSPRDVVREEP